MPYRKIGDEVKELAMSMRQRGWEIDDICDTLQFDRSSFFRWQAYMRTFGSPMKPPNPLQGSVGIITCAVFNVLVGVYRAHPDICLSEVCTFLAVHHDIDISVPALQETLSSAGLTRKMLHKIAKERDAEACAEFERALEELRLRGDGTELVFVDETSKNGRTGDRTHGRAMAGERADIELVFNRGQRYSLIAALTIDGYTATQVVPDAIDSLEFFSFIAESVLPNMNPYPDDRSVLVLDNCRIHHYDALKWLVFGAGCILLFTPPYAPSYNPIEESFSSFKAFLRREGLHLDEMEDPRMALIEATGCITRNLARAWFKHAGYIHD